ncbi:hypothetical protein H7U20_20290 [Rugamonas sp. CCM 8940]|nr:hypothetical protein [Rugamonas sp. CCM 8940]
MRAALAALAALLVLNNAQALASSPDPDLDLQIHYYSKALTPDGVTRESRYEETMLRRAGHVWVARVLPPNAQPAKGHGHKEFNHAMLPRHVALENSKLRLTYVDAHEKQVIAIPPSEYDNVSFDGSWENAYHLIDPRLVLAMPLSRQASAVPGARWRERVKNGQFHRVLWDEQKQIALVIESGDQAATFYRRVEVKAQGGLTRALPWRNLASYGQKEYADFLD